MTGDLRWVVAELQDGMTVRTVLRRSKGVSSRLMRKAIYDTGELFVNGSPARFVDKVRAGDEIRLVFPEEKSGFAPQDIPISVIYEDDDLLVLDKQPGIVVHPTKGHADGTVANGVMRHMLARGESYKIRFISRLDMDTSGVLLCGKNAHAQTDFARQAADGAVDKIYLAIVHGALRGGGLIDTPIAPPSDGTPRRTVKPEAEGGYPSRTEWACEKVFAPAASGGRTYSLVRLRLLTGRTHQIRVHMASIGHPVVFDALYGETPGGAQRRQLLHAAALRFRHPRDGRALGFEAPLPQDMQDFLKL
ncbi:MAG: RluA family pseudouridine synthase [Clostridiales Family XIII bacterium]|nr:RluA family pseudouridine synthase [Clostridiales Family XIII bacterium]